MNATAKYLTKDQDWSEGTTTYWFEVSNEIWESSRTYGVQESEGQSRGLDCDGNPLTPGDYDAQCVERVCIVTDEMRAE